jgi:TRAP-type C4-dicarboxylate transport system substrate-binding protein
VQKKLESTPGSKGLKPESLKPERLKHGGKQMIKKFSLSVAALAAGLAGVTSFDAPVVAKELKFASFVGGPHPMNRFVFAPWTEEVAKMSGGDLTVKMYYGGALGKGGTKQFKRAVDGVADITWALQGYTANQFRKTTMIELIGVGADPVDATKRMWKIYNDHLADEYKRVKVLAIWAADAPVLHSKVKPITGISDLKGMKIRTPSQYQAWLVQALGATPVPMPAGKIYNSLDRGVIDGVLIATSAIKSFKLNEVTKHHADGIAWGQSPFFAVMNKKSWDSLSKKHKDIIDKTTGLAMSIKAASIYMKAGAKVLSGLKKDKNRSAITFSAAEVAKANALLKKAEQDIIARVKKEGVDTAPTLNALRGAGG